MPLFLALDDTDLPIAFDKRRLHLRQILQALLAQLHSQLIFRDELHPHVAAQHFAFPDQRQRRRLDQATEPFDR